MSTNLQDILSQRWVHSHEEDTDSTQVFRSGSHQLPPSRGRLSFELRADGKMIWHGLGASDRSQKLEGTWKLEKDNLILSPQSERHPGQVLKIASATPDRLVVEK